MSGPHPRPFSLRLGLRQYQITAEEFMNPAGLVDSILDENICETGGFIGRLETWTQDDGDKNVVQVKTFISHESSAHLFHPEWLTRRSLLHLELFDINPIHDQTVEATTDEGRVSALRALTRLQSRMRGTVNKCDFSHLTKDEFSAELSNLLENESSFHCADSVLDNLENQFNQVVYLQNMEVTPPLETCAGLSMSSMNTGLQKLGNKPILGINKPSVYIGTEYSTFPCHREDMSFLAMNRHIAGAPKVWFCVPPAYYEAFTWMLRNYPIPEEQKSTVCHLLHKNIWISPRTVVSCGIPVYTIVQRPGDIVYLMPNTVHWGFNVGLNMNEAVNFACQAWVLPAMVCHQRCRCKEEWYCRFEIRDVLVSHGAHLTDVKFWSTGSTFLVAKKLRTSQPLLYPRLKDAFEYNLDEDMMASGYVKATLGASEPDAGGPYPKCTLCSYCPKRCRSDAFDRIKAHVRRCHSPEIADQVIKEAKEMYERTQHELKKGKSYKCPPIECDLCKKIIHGNKSSLRDHKAGSKCVPHNEISSVSGPAARTRRKRNVDPDDPDSPSFSSGTKKGNKSARRK